jgi:hypothetical protein
LCASQWAVNYVPSIDALTIRRDPCLHQRLAVLQALGNR